MGELCNWRLRSASSYLCIYTIPHTCLEECLQWGGPVCWVAGLARATISPVREPVMSPNSVHVKYISRSCLSNINYCLLCWTLHDLYILHTLSEMLIWRIFVILQKCIESSVHFIFILLWWSFFPLSNAGPWPAEGAVGELTLTGFEWRRSSRAPSGPYTYSPGSLTTGPSSGASTSFQYLCR